LTCSHCDRNPDAGASPSKKKRSRVEVEFDTSARQNFKSTLNRGRSMLLRYFGNIVFKDLVCKVGSPPENGRML
jgi:hypothetical protein